jgi:hypothetical protein
MTFPNSDYSRKFVDKRFISLLGKGSFRLSERGGVNARPPSKGSEEVGLPYPHRISQPERGKTW